VFLSEKSSRLTASIESGGPVQKDRRVGRLPVVGLGEGWDGMGWDGRKGWVRGWGCR
jgi:hypothetical protein